MGDTLISPALRWVVALVGVAVVTGGCVTRPSGPDVRQEALRSFGAVYIWKPSNAAVASPLALLPPFILAEGPGEQTRPAALGFGPRNQVEPGASPPVLYVHSDTVMISALDGPQSALTPALSHPMGEGARRAGEGNSALHPVDSPASLGERLRARVTYWWFGLSGNPIGLRMTLNSEGAPVIWEVADQRMPAQLIYVAKSLEAQALAAFGKPLDGRQFAIEKPVKAAPRTVVVRVLEDGPVPMGPMVYLSGSEVASVICRCMPAQAREVAGSGEFGVEPAEPLARRWLEQRGVAVDQAIWPVVFGPVERVLRLPPSF
jgi:hypothetical protein